jgi:hypothetical protein
MKTAMGTLLGAVVLFTLSLGAGTARAEDLTLFQASTAGADAWGWGDAKLKAGSDGLSIQEAGKSKSVGDVYVLERFAFLPEGIVELDVNRVVSGSFTLQLLAFKGDANIGSQDLVTESKTGGKLQFPLSAVKLPAETERITFKIWVGGAKGATTVLNDLKYTASIPADKIVFDKPITSNSTEIETDKTSWTASDTGGTLAIKSNDPSELIGSAVVPDVMKTTKEGTLLLDVPSVKNGTISIQLAAFDDKGAYLNSVEVLNKVGAGWHAVNLGKVQWPEGTDSFKVKIWIGGQTGSIATAVLKRMMVVK